MTLILAFALVALLLHRLGLFTPYREQRALLQFEYQILQMAEEIDWHERMARRARRHPARMPSVQFKAARQG